MAKTNGVNVVAVKIEVTTASSNPEPEADLMTFKQGVESD